MGRLPVPGRVKTRLTPRLSLEQAARVYRAFLLDVFDLVSEAAGQIPFTPWFVCALHEGEGIDQAQMLVPAGWRVAAQEGPSLGARIEHARRVTAAEQVVVIGSDSPTMARDRIPAAFRALDEPEVDAAFGPTSDGGYDLIAMRKPVPSLLDEIPWSTERVMKATEQAAMEAGLKIVLLAEGYDLDCYEDLIRAYQDASKPGSLARRTASELRDVLAPSLGPE